jgi:hypothetical protein
MRSVSARGAQERYFESSQPEGVEGTVVAQLRDPFCFTACMSFYVGTSGFGFQPPVPNLDQAAAYCERLCALSPLPYPPPPTPPPIPPTPFLPTSVAGWGAVGALALIDLAAIAWAVHDISSAWNGPTEQPPVTPEGCTGGFFELGKVTGWSVPIAYPGCAGAWDHAQDNAQDMCTKSLQCSGRCPDGQNCRPIAILKDRIDETRYVVTCRAEGSYRCECGCYAN